MKKLISIILTLMITFMGLNSCALAKKVKSDNSNKIVKEKVKKEKTTKVKKEKTKTQKIKKEKVKTTKVKPEKVKAEKTKAPKVKKEKTAKVKKEKTKQEKISKKQKKQSDEVNASSKKKTKVKDLSSLSQVEREKALLERASETHKRTALGMFLNPNLDIVEIRAKHILVRNRKDALSIRKDILDGKITFEQAAEKYSLCPTGVNGGDLGYFNRKRMDQQFTDRAFDLKIGQVSEPVGTKFGWHLIKVTDKR